MFGSRCDKELMVGCGKLLKIGKCDGLSDTLYFGGEFEVSRGGGLFTEVAWALTNLHLLNINDLSRHRRKKLHDEDEKMFQTSSRFLVQYELFECTKSTLGGQNEECGGESWWKEQRIFH